MRRMKYVMLILLSVFLFTTTAVHVYGLGTLKMYPYWPYMSGTEEEFHVWIEGSGTAYEPRLFLVMTETCYANLADPGAAVEIDFEPYGVSPDITLYKSDFTPNYETDNSVKIPSWAEEGVKYTVASLKSHLESEDPIRWCYVSFPTYIDGDGVWFKIKLHSSQPRMLVYVFGKTDSALPYWNIKVPPTMPGFLVPEPATIAAVATPMLTLLGYAYYKRKTLFS